MHGNASRDHLIPLNLKPACCNLDLTPALRTRVARQNASTGASLDVPHAFFTWKSCPLAQWWVNEVSHLHFTSAAVPMLTAEPSGPPAPQAGGGMVTEKACRVSLPPGSMGRRWHSQVPSLLPKVSENSEHATCLLSLRAGSCIKRGEELKHLQTALSTAQSSAVE